MFDYYHFLIMKTHNSYDIFGIFHVPVFLYVLAVVSGPSFCCIHETNVVNFSYDDDQLLG